MVAPWYSLKYHGVPCKNHGTKIQFQSTVVLSSDTITHTTPKKHSNTMVISLFQNGRKWNVQLCVIWCTRLKVENTIRDAPKSLMKKLPFFSTNVKYDFLHFVMQLHHTDLHYTTAFLLRQFLKWNRLSNNVRKHQWNPSSWDNVGFL